MRPGSSALPMPRAGLAAAAGTFSGRAAGFVLLHVPLAFVLMVVPMAGAAHAAYVLYYGLAAALRRSSPRVMYSLGYVAGAEVLWRMTGAPLPWEFGKYASVLIVCVGIITEAVAAAYSRHGGRSGRRRDRIGERIGAGSAPGRSVSVLPLAYFFLLLPAVAPTILQLGLAEGREQISFNLSGPFALAVLALYLWRRPLTPPAVTRIVLAIIAPILGIMTLAAFSTITSNVDFAARSNFTTSGGFGPNQVSNLLGFGALAAVVLIVVGRQPRALRMLAAVLAGGFLVQALLTFSRGGVLSFLVAFTALGLHVLRAPGARRRFLILVVATGLLGGLVVVPFVDVFTGGALRQRYGAADSTGRTALMQAELYAFEQNLFAGTGVGLAAPYREEVLGKKAAAHTEVTRMLAEHGMLGGLSLLFLLAMVFGCYRAARTPVARGLVAAFGLWTFSVMLQSAMRFVAIAFAFGLVTVLWEVGREGRRPGTTR